MRIDATRQVDHRLIVDLDPDEFYDEAVASGWRSAYDGQPFQVREIRWPARYDDDMLTDDSYVTLMGPIYRKDGSVGQRLGGKEAKVRDLPELIRSETLAAFKRIYAP